MATIVLGAIGSSIGASIGGSILGVGAAVIGRAIGSAVGRMIDQSFIAMLTPDQQNFGPEVDGVGLSLPREGQMLARGAGWQKLPARIIWPENLQFSEESESVSTGGKGAQNKSTTTTYHAEVTIAIALRDGETGLIGRVWADNSAINLEDFCNSVTVYKGTKTQDPDPTIEAVEGAGNVPDWRGITYLVLEGFNLESFGDRIPQLFFETFSGVSAASETYRGVTLLPTGGEFGLNPERVTEQLVETIEEAGGTEEVVIEESPVNNNAVASTGDIKTALELLKYRHPQVDHVLIEYPWFGDDLRCGECEIKPRVEMAARETAPDLWTVQGIARGMATVISQVDGAGAYAATPSDKSVIALIEELKNRGYSVTLSPRISLDIAGGNGLADPYGAAEQAAYPARGLITCHPAAGEVGTVDKTAAAATQVDAFFGSVVLGDYAIADQVLSFSGTASDWGLRRFIFHAASLAIAAGGVDTFAVADGLAGITRIRSGADTYPAPAKLAAITAELRAQFDAVRTDFWGANWGDKVTYRIDSEGDGVSFIASEDPVNGVELSFVASDDPSISQEWRIEGYLGLSATAAAYASGSLPGFPYDGGVDGYFLKKGSGTHAAFARVDVPVPTPGLTDIRATFQHGRWGGIVEMTRSWSISDYDSSAGFVKTLFSDPDNYASVYAGNVWKDDTSGLFTADVEGDFLRFSYQLSYSEFVLRDLAIEVMERRHVALTYRADWQEYGAHDVRDGSGDVFFPLDVLWASADIDFISINYAPPLADVRSGDAESAHDLVYLKSSIEGGEAYDWEYLTDDDRRDRVQTPITDVAHAEPWVFRKKDLADWWGHSHHARPAGVRDGSASAWLPGNKKIALFFGCPAIDRGANQPDAEINPYAAAFALPHYSSGSRDDIGQASYLRAIAEFWAADGRGVVDAARSCAAGWDARPWPIFPHTDLWPDAEYWPTGLAISGRGQVSLASWLAEELEYRGLEYELEQVSGAIDGITVENLAGFGAVIAPVLSVFHLDAVEVDGKIRITSRALQVATETIDLGAVVPLSKSDRYRAPRGNVGSIPAIAYLSHNDVGHDYGTNTVQSRLSISGNGESFTDSQVLIDPQTAGDLIRSGHLDGIVALDNIEFSLPPSWLARVAPGRTVLADTGRGLQEWLITKRNIGEALKIEGRRLDRAALLPSPTTRVGYAAPAGSVTPASAFAMPDLPWLAYADPAHDLRAAVWVNPAQASVLMRSISEETGFSTVGAFGARASVGVLLEDLAAGSPLFWDRGNTLSVRLFSGDLISRAEIDVRGGDNWLAVRTDAETNTWELMAFANADLVAPNTYDLSQLLRGLRGSQIVASISAGAMVVFLENLPFAGVGLDEIETPFWWSAGPSAKPRTDASWLTRQITPRGVGLKPFAPSRLSGEILGGDLVLSWRRQDRDPRADQLDRISTPMSEDALLFKISIGEATWQSPTENLTIPALEIPAAPYVVTVQQISSDVGLGYAATVTME